MQLTPTSTPTKKRTIRDISNTFHDIDAELPLTPTKTPNKKQVFNFSTQQDGEPSCKGSWFLLPQHHHHHQLNHH